MVIVPNRFTFVATPRTGSRAISEALLRRYPDAISEYPNNHHAAVEEVPRDFPIYAVIRDPYTQVLSWWAHVDVRSGSWRTPVDFAKEYENVMFFPRDTKYTLNIYAEIADELMPYDDGLETVANILDLHDIEVVGKSNNLQPSLDHWHELVRVVDQQFPADVALWEKLSNV